MFCPFCGKEIADNAYVCVGCGNKVAHVSKAGNVRDSGSVGWWWLGFFIPLAGLLIWLFGHDSIPKTARRAGYGALVGVIVSVVLTVAFYILWAILMIGFQTSLMTL